MMPIFRSKTPDEQLAADVRRAAKNFNTAVEAARREGLSITERLHYRWGDRGEIFINRFISIEDIYKTDTTKL